VAAAIDAAATSPLAATPVASSSADVDASTADEELRVNSRNPWGALGESSAEAANEAAPASATEPDPDKEDDDDE
jgi:hypothetical protein